MAAFGPVVKYLRLCSALNTILWFKKGSQDYNLFFIFLKKANSEFLLMNYSYHTFKNNTISSLKYMPQSYTAKPRVIVMSNSIKVQTRIINVIKFKQDGVCRKCKGAFSQREPVISTGKKRKYYHERCAKLLNIIWAFFCVCGGREG